MASGARTFTLDTAGMDYIDKGGTRHSMKTSQTLKFYFTDTGDGGFYEYLSGLGVETPIVCNDGFTARPIADRTYTLFRNDLDGILEPNQGEVAFFEDGFGMHRWKVKLINTTDADSVGANNTTVLTLESIDRPNTVMYWTNINSA